MSGLKKFLEASEAVASNIKAGDTVPTDRFNENKLHIDSDTYDIMEEEFGLYGEETNIPALAINKHFTERRADTKGGVTKWLEETDLETDDEGNPYLSDMIRHKTGDCAEMAATAQIWADEMIDNVQSYMVNGLKQGADDYQVSPHAFLLLEKPDQEYLMFDPATTLNYEQGENVLIAPIQNVTGDGEIILEDDWQDTVEGIGFKYRL